MSSLRVILCHIERSRDRLKIVLRSNVKLKKIVDSFKSQEPRAKSQEPRAKSQEPRAKSQEPGARSQEPRPNT